MSIGVQTGLWLTFRANLMRQELWIGAVGAWALEARLFMRRSIEGLGLVPPVSTPVGFQASVAV